MTGKFLYTQGQGPERAHSTPASELSSDPTEPETSWVIPQDIEEEAGSLSLRILPDAAEGSARSCLCQGLLRGSLGEERDLVQAQRGAKLRQEA